MADVTVPAEDTETITLKMSNDSGFAVVVTAEYPRGHALLAINALREAGSEQIAMNLLSELRDDESVAKMLKERGLGFADDDDDEDW
jgi:hypothetical protein